MQRITFLKRIFRSDRGVSLYLTVLILAIMLAMVLGLSAIVIGQIRSIRSIGNSVVALYAADTGTEQVLQVVYSNAALLVQNYNGTLASGTAYESSYVVQVVCASSTNCPSTRLTVDPQCTSAGASSLCVRSVGTYKDIKRAIEVTL